MPKDFDAWNKQKKILNGSDSDSQFHVREIWWGSLGLNIGVESDGKNDSFERPLLILRIFNREMLWVLPITSTLKDSPFYYRFMFKDVEQSIMLSQIRVISAKRLRRRVNTLSEINFTRVLEELIRLLDPRFILKVKNETPLQERGISDAEAIIDL